MLGAWRRPNWTRRWPRWKCSLKKQAARWWGWFQRRLTSFRRRAAPVQWHGHLDACKWKAPGGEATCVYFDDFHLPAGVELRFQTPEGRYAQTWWKAPSPPQRTTTTAAGPTTKCRRRAGHGVRVPCRGDRACVTWRHGGWLFCASSTFPSTLGCHVGARRIGSMSSGCGIAQRETVGSAKRTRW